MTTAQQNTNQPVQTIDQPLLEQIIAATQQAAAVLVSRQVVDWDKELRGAQYLLKSGLCPKQLKTAEAVLFVILAGRDLGLSPVASLRGLTIIQGKIEVSADLQLGLFHRAGGRSTWKELTEKVASITFAAPWLTRPHTATFSMADAQRAGLNEDTTKYNDDGSSYVVKSNYNLYPKAMLRSRAITQGLKDIGFDGTAGLYAPGEIGGDDAGHWEKEAEKFPLAAQETESTITQAAQKNGEIQAPDPIPEDEQRGNIPATVPMSWQDALRLTAEAGMSKEEFLAEMKKVPVAGNRVYTPERDTPTVLSIIAAKKSAQPKRITPTQMQAMDDLATQLEWPAERTAQEIFNALQVERKPLELTNDEAEKVLGVMRAKLGEGVPT